MRVFGVICAPARKACKISRYSLECVMLSGGAHPQVPLVSRQSQQVADDTTDSAGNACSNGVSIDYELQLLGDIQVPRRSMDA